MTSTLVSMVGGIIKFLTLNFFLIGTFADLIKLLNNDYDPRISIILKSNSTYTPAEEQARKGIVWNTGSEKQTDWADGIVERYVKKANKMIANSYEKGLINDDEGKKLASEIGRIATGIEDANWWIDNRTLSTKELTLEIVEDNQELVEIVEKMAE